MKKTLTIFGVMTLVFSLYAASPLSFSYRPLTAGRALLEGEGFVETRILGTANFSPELRLPVQLVYASSSKRTGLFGYAWNCPQLESFISPHFNMLEWVSPWNETFIFGIRDNKVLPLLEWEAICKDDSPKNSGNWEIQGRNQKKGWSFSYEDGRLTQISSPSNRSIELSYVLSNDGKIKELSVIQNDKSFIEISCHGGLVKTIEINGIFTTLDYQDVKMTLVPKTAVGHVMEITRTCLKSITVPGLAPVSYEYANSYLSCIKQGKAIEYINVHEDSRPFPAGAKDNGMIISAGRILNDGKYAYTYGKTPGVVTLADLSGRTTAFSFNRADGTLTYTDAAGRQTVILYYMRHDVPYVGKVRKIIDFKKRDVFFCRYDAENGEPLLMRNIFGHETSIGYDADGNLARISRRASSKRDFAPYAALSHDASGRPVSISLLEDDGTAIVTTTIRRNQHGEPVTIDNGRQNDQFEYNPFGYKTVSRDAIGRENRFVYDEYNNLLEITDANGLVTRLARTPSGLLARIEKSHHGETTAILSIHYDDNGLPVAWQDNEGRERKFERDAFGRVVHDFLPDGTSTGYSYDEVGRLKQVLDPNGNRLRFDWNQFGLASRSNDISQVTNYAYDDFGVLSAVEQVQPGRLEYRIQRVLDQYDRTVKNIYAKGGTEEFEYDEWGRVARHAQGNRSATYEYDKWNRLIGKRESGVTTQYAYDAWGARVSRITRTDSDILSEHRTYDRFGRLLSIESDGRRIEYSYDQKGRVEKQSLDGMPVYFLYTSQGLLASKRLGSSTSPRASLDYFYDKTGRLVARSVNGEMQHFEYDLKEQLRAIRNHAGKILEAYTYDAAGNILSRTIDGKTTRFRYDAGNQLVSMTAPDGTTTEFVYDAAGRLIQEGARSYEYGWMNKVLAIRDSRRKTASYDYFVDGQLSHVQRGEVKESFLWDDLALIKRNQTNYVNEPHAGGGAPVLAGKDGRMFNDALGNTLGRIVKDGYQRVSMTSFGDTADDDVFFTGKPHIDGLGYAFLFRNYRPDLGKWTMADPLGYPNGWNNMAYCNNMILIALDPSGLWSILKWLYTGDGNASDEVYEAAISAAGAFLFDLNPTLTIGGNMTGCYIGGPSLSLQVNYNIISADFSLSTIITGNLGYQQSIGGYLGIQIFGESSNGFAPSYGFGFSITGPLGFNIGYDPDSGAIDFQFSLSKGGGASISVGGCFNNFNEIQTDQLILYLNQLLYNIIKQRIEIEIERMLE